MFLPRVRTRDYVKGKGSKKKWMTDSTSAYRNDVSFIPIERIREGYSGFFFFNLLSFSC